MPVDNSATVVDASGRATAKGPERDHPDEILWSRVADLPERERHAVVLKYVVDLDHVSIAKALGTTPTMSRRLVSDGLASLRLAIAREEI